MMLHVLADATHPSGLSLINETPDQCFEWIFSQSKFKKIFLYFQGQPVLASGKDVERPEEKNILATLHEEGLIQRPIANRAFGVSFEVFAENSEFPGVLKKPPPRLAKLENKKRKKKVLTEEEIKEKLRQAEERRKVINYW